MTGCQLWFFVIISLSFYAITQNSNHFNALTNVQYENSYHLVVLKLSIAWNLHFAVSYQRTRDNIPYADEIFQTDYDKFFNIPVPLVFLFDP